MTWNRKINAEKVKQVHELRRAGWDWAYIANAVGLHIRTAQRCLKYAPDGSDVDRPPKRREMDHITIAVRRANRSPQSRYEKPRPSDGNVGDWDRETLIKANAKYLALCEQEAAAL